MGAALLRSAGIFAVFGTLLRLPIYLAAVLRWLAAVACFGLMAITAPARAELRWAAEARASTSGSVPEALAALYQRCGARHHGLVQVARHVAKQVAAGRGPEAGPLLTQRVRAAGVPHPGPRAWALTGAHEPDQVAARLAAWLGSGSAPRQCGVVRRGRGADQVIAVVTTEALASMQPFPIRTTAFRWQTLDAEALFPIDSASVVLLGPHGAPHRVPVSLQQGRIRARFRLDRPGRWLVQLVGVLNDGPRPLLTIESYVDAEPPAELTLLSRKALADDAALLRQINGERKRAGRPPLVLDRRLQQLAAEHARAMAAGGRVAHDLGQGYPNARASRLGLDGSRVGENVARATSVAGLLQAWWDSPSHRDNLLDGRFRGAGVAVVSDARGHHYGSLMLMR